MENMSFEEIKQKNDEFKRQLTKKNEQYLFQLDRTLKEFGLTEEEREERYVDTLRIMVENQKNGVTARQLFGTVSSYSQSILKMKETPKESTSKKLIWLDGSLMMGGVIALMAGFMGLQTNQANAGSIGLITLLLNFLIGGGILLLMKQYAPDFDKPKGQRGYWKYFGISILATFLWLVVILASQTLLPPSINITLDPFVYLVIAGLAFAVKWYLKKKYNIAGTFI